MNRAGVSSRAAREFTLDDGVSCIEEALQRIGRWYPIHDSPADCTAHSELQNALIDVGVAMWAAMPRVDSLDVDVIDDLARELTDMVERGPQRSARAWRASVRRQLLAISTLLLAPAPQRRGAA